MEKLKVIYLEDDVVDQMLFERCCQKVPQLQILEVCQSLSQSIKALERHSPDLIISDNFLGPDSAENILPLINKTPLVILSGSKLIHSTIETDPKFIGYFMKPLKVGDLEKIIALWHVFSMDTNWTRFPSNEMLHRLAKGKQEVVNRIVSIYLSELHQENEIIRNYCGPQDNLTCVATLHKAKAKFKFFEMFDYYHVADYLEIEIREGIGAQRNHKALLYKIQQAMELLLEHMSSILN